MKKLLMLVAVVGALVAGAPSAETVASVAGAVGIESASAEPFYCDGVAPNALIEFVAVDNAAACGAINQGWIRITPCVWYWEDWSGWRWAAVWQYQPTGHTQVMECLGGPG